MDMADIILLSGNVKYPITLDPGVWIFDDRRIDLNTWFIEKHEEKDELEEYTKAVSKHWDREIIEGAIYPPTLKSEKKYEKEKLLTGTFGISFKPFLKNAEPEDDAKWLVIQTVDSVVEVPLEVAYDLIFKFSDNGKPVKDGGPIHILYNDGSNQDHPIKNVTALTVK
jgi:cell division protein YceG involved in septum cleavage